MSYFSLFSALEEALLPIVEKPWQGGPPEITSILSNKRTILSYLRTSLALFSFGLAVDKFFIVNIGIILQINIQKNDKICLK